MANNGSGIPQAPAIPVAPAVPVAPPVPAAPAGGAAVTTSSATSGVKQKLDPHSSYEIRTHFAALIGEIELYEKTSYQALDNMLIAIDSFTPGDEKQEKEIRKSHAEFMKLKSDAQDRSANLTKKIDALESQLQELRKNIKSTEDTISFRTKKVIAAKDAVAKNTFEASLKTAQDELEQHKDKMREAEKDLSDSRTRLKEMQEHIEQLRVLVVAIQSLCNYKQVTLAKQVKQGRQLSKHEQEENAIKNNEAFYNISSPKCIYNEDQITILRDIFIDEEDQGKLLLADIDKKLSSLLKNIINPPPQVGHLPLYTSNGTLITEKKDAAGNPIMGKVRYTHIREDLERILNVDLVALYNSKHGNKVGSLQGRDNTALNNLIQARAGGTPPATRPAQPAGAPIVHQAHSSSHPEQPTPGGAMGKAGVKKASKY